MRVFSCLVAAVLLGPSLVCSADLEVVIAAVEKAYGGRAAVERLETYRVVGETTSWMRGETGKVLREYDGPDRLRVEIAYPGRTEIRVVTGKGVWRGDAGGLRETEGPMREAVLFQLLRCNPPAVLTRHRERLSDGGEVEQGRRSHQLLILEWSPALTMRYWVQGVITAGEVQLVFATSFSDFRTVDGVVFPFAEKNYASGRHVADTKIEQLDLYPDVVEAALPTDGWFSGDQAWSTPRQREATDLTSGGR